MLTDSEVRQIQLERNGQTYTAYYFVEFGVLYATVAGQAQATACTTNPEDQTRALLEARILELAGKQRR